MIDNITINSVSYCFIGVFEYEESSLQNTLISKSYIPFDLYAENKEYFDQKYYSNWIDSFFLNNESNQSKHLKLNPTSELFYKNCELSINKVSSSISYTIKEIDIFLFKANLGIFIIKIDLPKTKISWLNTINFGATFRQTTINNKQNIISQSVEMIERFITSKFHSNSMNWRKYNPQLKSAIFVDIDESIPPGVLDKLLYQLGTFSMSIKNNSVFEPNEKYLNQLLDEGEISIFDNWKVLCLYDSITRIAVNLNEKDTYKLWENEYILIYVYVLYARYFLYNMNKQLTEVFGNLKLVEMKRNEFYSFRNEFNHSKISYKFLPNIIYSKLKETLEIKEEMILIDEKLTRTNILKQEAREARVNRILFLLTLLTLISVSYDGGQMLYKWEWTQSIIISIAIIVISISIIVFYFRKK